MTFNSWQRGRRAISRRADKILNVCLSRWIIWLDFEKSLVPAHSHASFAVNYPELIYRGEGGGGWLRNFGHRSRIPEKFASGWGKILLLRGMFSQISCSWGGTDLSQKCLAGISVKMSIQNELNRSSEIDEKCPL